MTTTMTIAYLLLPVFAVMTISMIINARRYKQIMKDCIEHPALLGFTSMVTLFGGTAIVLYHNTWTADRTTAISVIGWLMVLK